LGPNVDVVVVWIVHQRASPMVLICELAACSAAVVFQRSGKII
jgi:hypothetical protein